MYNERNPDDFKVKAYTEVILDTHDKGGFDQRAFYKAYYEYINQSIEKSLNSPDCIVRLFAILDKRVGKRTLLRIKPTINSQPHWLQQFYLLRLNSLNINQIIELF
jgi:hypothetical protein